MRNFASPDDVDIACFAEVDAQIAAAAALPNVGGRWRVVSVPPPGPYPRRGSHVEEMSSFIEQVLRVP